jgi:hypothetical protein
MESDTSPKRSQQDEKHSLYHVRLNTCLMNFSDVLQQHQQQFPNTKKIINYDECTQQLIILFPEQGKLTRLSSVATGSRNSTPTKQINTPIINKREITFSVQNKTVINAKFSLDDKFIAFQSNPSVVVSFFENLFSSNGFFLTNI